jgi:hypothetical protein
MAVMVNCVHCKKTQDAVLNTIDNQVYCGVCDNVAVSNHFTKTQLKALGQIRKPPRQAYSVRCEKCKQETLPKLDVSDKFVCGFCSNALVNISAPFAILIRRAIREGNKEI